MERVCQLPLEDESAPCSHADLRCGRNKKGGNDETYYSRYFDHLFVYRHSSGAILRKPRREQRRQTTPRRGQKQLRKEVQEGCLRKQGGEQRGQAALRCGQKQLSGKVQKGCLDRHRRSSSFADRHRQAALARLAWARADVLRYRR